MASRRPAAPKVKPPPPDHRQRHHPEEQEAATPAAATATHVGQPRGQPDSEPAAAAAAASASPSPSPSSRRAGLLRFDMDARGDEVLVMAGADDKGAGSGPGDGEGPTARPTRGRNTVVMMRWEKEYMERLVAALDIRAGEDEVRGKGGAC